MTERELNGAHLVVGEEESGGGGDSGGNGCVERSRTVSEDRSPGPGDAKPGINTLMPVASPYMTQQLPPLTK